MTICERHSGGRILCLRLSGLGDIVHSLNALSLLRQERPDAHIAWIVEERFSALLDGHPYLDELIVVPRSHWLFLLNRPSRWPSLGSALWDFASGLRERRFDISVDFQSSLKSAWLVKAAGAGLRVGFDRPVNRELNRLVQNCLVRAPITGVHRIERDLALLGPLGIPTRYADALLPVSRPDREAVEEMLTGRPGAGLLVVLHPGTSRAAAFKRWEPERYAQVADALVTERGADVVITHGPEDRDLAEEVLALMRHRVAFAPRTYNLQQLAHLLSRTGLFIGSDTGPMHMASALKVPVVALFGPKDPVQTGPYCARSIVVTGRASCRPCSLRTCSYVRCMTSITPERVIKAALDVLDGKGRCRAHEGPIKKPFTVAFELGQWRGRITTCYSAPEFYARLCDPDALMSAGDVRTEAETIKAVSVQGNLTGLAERLTVRRHGPDGRLRHGFPAPLSKRDLHNAWKCSLRLSLSADPSGPVLFPVCYMEKGKRRRKDQLLVTEEAAGAASLDEWQASGRMANWLSTSCQEKDELIDGIARAIRAFHMAAYCHGNLTGKNILVRPGGDLTDAEVYLVGLERAKWVGRLPPVLRAVLYGHDLGRLALSLAIPLRGTEAWRFFEAYCKGFILSDARRRVVAHAAIRYVRRCQRQCH